MRTERTGSYRIPTLGSFKSIVRKVGIRTIGHITRQKGALELRDEEKSEAAWSSKNTLGALGSNLAGHQR